MATIGARESLVFFGVLTLMLYVATHLGILRFCTSLKQADRALLCFVCFSSAKISLPEIADRVNPGDKYV
jgi:hypothetical protein